LVYKHKQCVIPGLRSNGYQIMIRITDTIFIHEKELQETFTRASGPGGQHVNKVATAVLLRFDVGKTKAFSDSVKKRLIQLAGRRISENGVLIIRSDRFRLQTRNRQDVRNRLAAMIRQVIQPPKVRLKLRPSRQSIMKRLEDKRQRSAIKKLRKAVIS
jgi:ribosome-associated protein